MAAAELALKHGRGYPKGRIDMAQKLASDMASKSISALLEKVEQQEHFPPDEARELLDACQTIEIVLDRLWELAQGFLDRGTEARKLAFLFKEFIDVFALGMRAYRAARERVEAAELKPDEKTDGLSFLAQATRSAAEKRDDLAALVHRLEALPRVMDLSSLPPASADRDAPGYVSLEVLAERLLSRDES